VIPTHTGAADNQDDIRAGGLNRLTNGCNGAINAALLDEETTVAGNEAGEHRSICIVNAPERQGRSGFNHIASSEDTTYARAAHAWNWADPGRRKKAHVSRAHFAACRREPASPHGMAAGAFDAGAGNNRLQDAAGSIPSIRDLIGRGDRIGT